MKTSAISGLLIIFLNIIFGFNLFSQDTVYARKIIRDLASKEFYGRGYVKKGDSLAADYISGEFNSLHLQKFDSSFYQPLYFSVNTLVGNIAAKIDQLTLVPGKDFLVSASSCAIKGEFELVYLKRSNIKSQEAIQKFSEEKAKNKIVVIDRNEFKGKDELDFIESLYYTNFLRAKGYIQLSDQHLFWSVSNAKKANDYVYIHLLREKLPKKAAKIEITVNNKFYLKYNSQNVIAYVPGAVRADSFFVFTAHYDHLGMMGNEVYFPGANDNAAGIAMLLNLARYYSLPENKPHYSMVFIAFTGEEMGLLGSKYFVENPVFSLRPIRFLVNLDMVGTGQQGVTVVNGSVFGKEFKLLSSLNDTLSMLPSVKKRDEAANSDHYYFYKKSVPCFFIYGAGGSPAYHDMEDVAEAIDLKGFSHLFQLMTRFVKGMTPVLKKH